MQYEIELSDIEEFLGTMMPQLNEKQRRYFLASFSKLMGRGSVTKLSEMTGVSAVTISKARQEIKTLKRNPRARPSSDDDVRIRSPGAGRRSATEIYPELTVELESLLEDNTIGDPMSPITWTTKSTRTLSSELKSRGMDVSNVTVSKILDGMGYSLQQNRKYIESGNPGPDRDGQFRFISSQCRSFMGSGCPVISVDAKKKELVGNYKNGGSEYRRKDDPRKVNDHDFCDTKAVPYGIYDIGRDEGYVNVGISKDTAEFAVNSIRSWWTTMGSDVYPEAKDVMITADCGGSNGRRNRLWKSELQRLADDTGLTFHVRHYPPGTSKWNKIEHRLFSFISMNRKGRPLESIEVIVNLIGNTTNSSGLKVRCDFDPNIYHKGIKVSDEELRGINISYEDWHGEWNYSIAPRQL